MKKVLVVGGAGYIGSHTCKRIAQKGMVPVTVDSLVYGHEWAVKWGPFYRENILNVEGLKSLMIKENISEVYHFAAYAYVGESVKDPQKYYDNNVSGTLSLLKAMREANVQKIIFSSTCATYGIPKTVPIDEETPQDPINPYGQSKLMIEKVLKDFVSAYGMKAVCLRYFNASGADLDGEIGEDHSPETHLIPLAIEAAYDDTKTLSIFGTDYPTPDGTCIRDYIHVNDLAEAHLLAGQWLEKEGSSFGYFNLGTGSGSSVKEIVSGIEKVSGRKVKTKISERRPGDPPSLVASGDKAKKVLGWVPKQSDLQTILASAVRWHEKHHFRKR